MRIPFLSAGLWLALCVFVGLPGQARADVGGVLFDKVKDALGSSVNPDQIMMARFAIAHPSEAAVVYSRAAAQDYPFFALAGAAKAGRRANILSFEQCKSPITVIDSVFAKADSTISDQQGKASTSAAMKTASNIAAEYAKAQTAEAKAQLVEQLSLAVPYFGDLPAICTFAFETDFTIEKDLQAFADQVSHSIVNAYNAFKSGDVVLGTDILISLGAGNEVVCAMVDNAVGGGIIGRTPLLGSLAKGACSGFVGAVIDGAKGIIIGGVGLLEKGASAVYGAGKAVVCEVYSWIASGCSDAEPPPPPPPPELTQAEKLAIAEAAAAKSCKAYGGLASFDVNDGVTWRCGDGSGCHFNGMNFACVTAKEIAAHKEQELQIADGQFQAGLPAWQAQFDQRWLGKCPDGACKAGMGVVKLNASQLAKSAHQAHPETYFVSLTQLIFEAADRQAVSVLDERNYRVLPGQWAAAFLNRGNKACEDDICRTGMRIVSTGVLLHMQQQAAATPRKPYGTAAAVYAEAEKQAAILVSEAAKRAVEFNKTNTANAAIAWELLTNAIWGKQCSDAQCLNEIKQLSAQMRVAANLVQLAHPDQSSMKVQGTVGSEYGPKFKAAVMASKERMLSKVPAVAATPVRAAGSLEPFIQKVTYPSAKARPGPKGGRPGPLPRPAPPMVSMQAGTDRMGGDYRGFALDQADPQLCRKACADEAVCRSYTYVNPGLKGPKAMCFLKKSTPPSTPSPCCTSGEKK
jgi:hypothetical protein